MTLWEIAIIVLIVNLPFGYWRANVRKLSWQWFLAVHLPVGLVILLRIVSGLGWQIATVPVLFAVFFAGQYLGAKLHRWSIRSARVPVTSCLVMDAMRMFQAGR